MRSTRQRQDQWQLICYHIETKRIFYWWKGQLDDLQLQRLDDNLNWDELDSVQRKGKLLLFSTLDH